MRILIISQYFWPENFRINDLSKYLSKKNKVTVITSQPSYPHIQLFKNKKNKNKYGSIKIIRLPTYPRGDSNFSIVLNYLSFILLSAIYSIKFIIYSNFDKVIVFGTSPPSGLILAHIIRIFKKVPIYYWILDMWPETLNSVGLPKNNFIYYILQKFMNYSYSRCKKIFCQSQSIKLALSRKIVDRKSTIYFPSWSENLPVFKAEKYKKLITKNNFNIMFTGNIGEAQDFESIIKAANILKKEKNIKWIIVGTGRYLKKVKLLISKLKLKENFIFLGPKDPKYIKYLSSLSDCLLISLKSSKIFSITVPGKLSNYMQSKKPILGMINGETKNIIKSANCGYCCSAGDYRMLTKNIYKLKRKSKFQNLKLGMNGYKYCNNFFNKKLLLQKFEKNLLN